MLRGRHYKNAGSDVSVTPAEDTDAVAAAKLEVGDEPCNVRSCVHALTPSVLSISVH